MSRRGNDMKGKTFGFLTTLEKLSRRSLAGDVYWRFKCKCGNTIDATASQVKKGLTYNCGCVDRTTHGLSFSKTYRAWSGMISRCKYPYVTSYHLYGGRGIKVCKRWSKFEPFLADMGECPAGMSIDRIDSNGNYEPNNCRWATNEIQSYNKRTTIRVKFEGKMLNLLELEEITGIPRGRIDKRLRRGFTIQQALDLSIKRRPSK